MYKIERYKLILKNLPAGSQFLLPLITVLLSIGLFMSGCSPMGSYSTLKPTSLCTDYHENPIGIDNKNPMLSWLFESSKPGLRNQNQAMYHILVASDPKMLDGEKGDLWDSGFIESDQSLDQLWKAEHHQMSLRISNTFIMKTTGMYLKSVRENIISSRNYRWNCNDSTNMSLLIR